MGSGLPGVTRTCFSKKTPQPEFRSLGLLSQGPSPGAPCVEPEALNARRPQEDRSREAPCHAHHGILKLVFFTPLHLFTCFKPGSSNMNPNRQHVWQNEPPRQTPGHKAQPPIRGAAATRATAATAKAREATSNRATPAVHPSNGAYSLRSEFEVHGSLYPKPY